MIDCPECDGTGIAVDSDTVVCGECDGFGEISRYRHFYDGVEELEGYYD